MGFDTIEINLGCPILLLHQKGEALGLKIRFWL